MTVTTTTPPPGATAAVVQLLALRMDSAAYLELGGIAAPRIFADVAPQGTPRPYVTVQTIGDPSTHHQGGVSNIRGPLVQVDTWAEDGASRDRVGGAVYLALDGAQLELERVAIRRVTVENAQDTAEPRGDGSGLYTFRRRVDARVWYVLR